MIEVKNIEQIGILPSNECDSFTQPYVWGSFIKPEPSVFEGIIKNKNPKRYFEFGTGCGVSVQIVKTVYPECECFSIDKDDFRTHRDGHSKQLGEIPEAHFWKGNTYTKRFPKSLFESFDIVLVDAGHWIADCANDTGRAMDLVKPGGLLMWHDVILGDTYGDVFEGEKYKNLKVSKSIEVAKYLKDSFPLTVTLIKGTTLAIMEVKE